MPAKGGQGKLEEVGVRSPVSEWEVESLSWFYGLMQGLALRL